MLRYDKQRDVWVDAQGKEHPISSLSDGHVLNIHRLLREWLAEGKYKKIPVKYVRQAVEDGYKQAIARLDQEIDKRGMFPKEVRSPEQRYEERFYWAIRQLSEEPPISR